jgi:hypothetical protein
MSYLLFDLNFLLTLNLNERVYVYTETLPKSMLKYPLEIKRPTSKKKKKKNYFFVTAISFLIIKFCLYSILFANFKSQDRYCIE